MAHFPSQPPTLVSQQVLAPSWHEVKLCRVELLSEWSHVQARTAQPRWIPAKRPMGSFGITPLLTFKELSSQEGLPDFENEKYVVSLLGRAQPPLSVVLLLIFWSFCPQRMNSSAHLGWEGHLLFLKLVLSTLHLQPC